MSLTVVDFVAISISSLLLILIISSTIYDVVTRKKQYYLNIILNNANDDPRKIWTAFSLQTNGRELLKFQTKSPTSIECFHGLRALSAFWVIGGHRVNRIDLMTSQPLQVKNLLDKLVIAVFSTDAVGYGVDVFFVVSGVLITKSCLNSLNRENLSLFKIYVNRYLRYIPTLAFLLLFFVSSIPTSIVNGHRIGYLRNNVASCDGYWWSSLLLIQNYINFNNLCLPATWYLSVDYQLFLLSPFFILLLWKFKYKVFWLFGVIICSTQIVIFFARYYNTISGEMIYIQTGFRVGQFLIGIALGYIMYMREGKNYMRKRSKIIGWVLSLSLFFAIEIFHETHKHQRFPEAFYHSVHRIVWAGLISWIIYVCHHLKSGGIVNWCLSQPLWQPIARISLSIYLVHDIYIILSVANMEARWLLNTSWLVHIIFGDLAISTLLGVIVYLVIEAPSNNILKCIMR